MQIEELIQKLRPVLGEKADALLLAFRMNPESRAEIARVVNALAARYLDPITDEVVELLEPPQQEIADGEYPLGMVCYGSQELHLFGLREDE